MSEGLRNESETEMRKRQRGRDGKTETQREKLPTLRPGGSLGPLFPAAAMPSVWKLRLLLSTISAGLSLTG